MMYAQIQGAAAPNLYVQPSLSEMLHLLDQTLPCMTFQMQEPVMSQNLI